MTGGLLCTTCRMVHLNTIMAVKLEVDSYSAALALLSQLPSILSVGKLIIRSPYMPSIVGTTRASRETVYFK
jgi:hypothetical protein